MVTSTYLKLGKNSLLIKPFQISLEIKLPFLVIIHILSRPPFLICRIPIIAVTASLGPPPPSCPHPRLHERTHVRICRGRYRSAKHARRNDIAVLLLRDWLEQLSLFVDALQVRLAAARALAGKILTSIRGGRECNGGEVIVGFVESAGFGRVGFNGEVGEREAEGCGD